MPSIDIALLLPAMQQVRIAQQADEEAEAKFNAIDPADKAASDAAFDAQEDACNDWLVECAKFFALVEDLVDDAELNRHQPGIKP